MAYVMAYFMAYFMAERALEQGFADLKCAHHYIILVLHPQSVTVINPFFRG